MNYRNKLSLIWVLMLIAALFSASFMSSFAVTQEEYDKAHEEAKAAQEATEAKRKEAKEIAKKASKAVANFEEAEKQLEQLAGEIENKKVEISNTEAKIDNKIAEIEAKKAEIEVKRAEMKAKEKEIEDQNTALNNRLVAMYKSGNAGMTDVILNSESIEELLTNVGVVHRILENDQKILKKLQEDYELLKQLKKELEEQQEFLEYQQLELEDEQAVLVDQQIGLEAKEYETDELKKRYQKEAEQMIVDAGGQLNLVPGQYAWPTDSNWELSDKYGWRKCPFHGKEFHNGLDIVLTSGTKGAPVYAIADGVVTKASWYGGYGNCIIYAIGNGYSVLYGHLSGYNCKEGQFVTKGRVLGYIGSTGASTGPHLHFTVFLNGDHINPFSLY